MQLEKYDQCPSKQHWHTQSYAASILRQQGSIYHHSFHSSPSAYQMVASNMQQGWYSLLWRFALLFSGIDGSCSSRWIGENWLQRFSNSFCIIPNKLSKSCKHIKRLSIKLIYLGSTVQISSGSVAPLIIWSHYRCVVHNTEAQLTRLGQVGLLPLLDYSPCLD